MKTLMLLGTVAWLATVLPAGAQPTGLYQYPGLGAGNQAIWDASGSYTIDEVIGDDTPIRFPVTVVQDAKGKLSGGGVVQVRIDQDTVTGTYTAKGSVSGSGASTTVTLKITLTGTGMIEGANRAYKVTLNYALRVNAATLQLLGTCNGSASAAGLGKGTINSTSAVPLPAGMNGTWSLTLNLQPTGTKYSGTAGILLSNGRSLQFSIAGTYTPATHVSALKLTGTGTGAGAKLAIAATGTPPVLGVISGSVLGKSLP